MSGVFERFKSFYKQPYQSQMNVGGWFLFIGLLLVLSLAWKMILRHINIAD